MSKRPDLSGTAKCGSCGNSAEYPVPHDPTSGPLVIRHTLDCPNRHAVLADPPRDLPGAVREFIADYDREGWSRSMDDRRADLAHEVFPVYLAYEDLFAHMADTNPADEIYTSRGHIVIRTTDNGETRSVALMDLGPVLHLWSGQGATLTPQIARQLGKELVAWADRKNPPAFDLMVTLTGDTLTELGLVSSADEVETLRLALDRGTFKIKANKLGWSPPYTDGVLIQEGHEIP